MYKIFFTLLAMVWIGDILNMPIGFFEYLDSVLPINTLAWMLIWLLVPSTNQRIIHMVDCDIEDE